MLTFFVIEPIFFSFFNLLQAPYFFLDHGLFGLSCHLLDLEAHIHNVFSFKVCDGLIIGCFVIQKTLEKLELLHPRLYKTIVVPLVYSVWDLFSFNRLFSISLSNPSITSVKFKTHLNSQQKPYLTNHLIDQHTCDRL